MPSIAHELFTLALQHKALSFGEFTQACGRVRPYAFNSDLLNTGDALAELGELFAKLIVSAGLDVDVVYGPAYKGIPLATATATALTKHYGRAVGWCFNRREGELHNPSLVGAPLEGKVIIVDDSVYYGGALRDAKTIIDQAGAELSGVALALDPQEPGLSHQSAVQEVQARWHTPTLTLATLYDLVEFLQSDRDLCLKLPPVEDYHAAYAV